MVLTGTEVNSPRLGVRSTRSAGADLLGAVPNAIREVRVQAQAGNVVSGAAQVIRLVQHVGDTSLLLWLASVDMGC